MGALVEDQKSRAQRALPYLIADMSSDELARYCDSTGLSDDPVINALIEWILIDAERLADSNERIFESVKEATQGDLRDSTAAMVELIRLQQETPPAMRPKKRTGPDEKFLPVILKMLRHTPTTRALLVQAVQRSRKVKGQSAIYRAITKAVEDRKIIMLPNGIYHLHPQIL